MKGSLLIGPSLNGSKRDFGHRRLNLERVLGWGVEEEGRLPAELGLGGGTQSQGYVWVVFLCT